jgi:selenocysteine-specific elongation factor
MSGFGTIVTGTLSDGQLSVGDEVEILPGGLQGRIRGLQTHKKNEEKAIPGSRTAVNISGIGTEQIQRGQVVSHPNQYQPTRRVDAQLRLLKDASSPVKHRDEVKFFVGASETVAVLRLLGMDELRPGEEAWIQLELREPVVAVRGDRYILRRPSPGETLGGGVIIDQRPKGRHKRFNEEVLKSLQSLSEGSPADILFEAAMGTNAELVKEMINRSRLEATQAESALEHLLSTNSLIPLEEGTPTTTSDILIIAAPHWNALREKVLQIIESYHKTYPLRRGIPREELKSRLKLTTRMFSAMLNRLITNYEITNYDNSVAKLGHKITFSQEEQTKIQALMRKFEQTPYSPPSVKDCQAEIGEEVLNALVELDELIFVSPDVLFRKQDYDLMVMKVRDVLIQNEKITLAGVRDLFNTSRKYAQALLEHLDTIGMTIRDGDFRKLKK